MASLLDQWRLLQRVLVDKRMSKGDAAVAGALLDFATDDGGAWPSIDKLAERAGLSRRMAIYSAGRLVETGYFTCERGGGRKNTTVYRPVYSPENGSADTTFSEAETVQPAAPFEAGNSAEDCTLSPPETVQHVAPFQLETVQSSAETVQSSVKKQCNGLHPNLPIEPAYKNPPMRDSISASFAEWWSIYPRRVAKRRAWIAYQKAAKAAHPDDLLAGAQRYATEREGQDQQYTKHPATWLHGACWLDEPAQGQAQARPQPSRGGSLAAAMALHAGLIDEAEGTADD